MKISEHGEKNVKWNIPVGCVSTARWRIRRPGKGVRNMKSMWLPLAAIFFMTYFHRAGGRGSHGPLAPSWICYRYSGEHSRGIPYPLPRIPYPHMQYPQIHYPCPWIPYLPRYPIPSGGSKGGRQGRAPPLGVQILSFSCSFWPKK